MRQTSILDWLITLTALAIPCAFLHYVESTTDPNLVAIGLALSSVACSWLLRNAAPALSTFFEVMALGVLFVMILFNSS